MAANQSPAGGAKSSRRGNAASTVQTFRSPTAIIVWGVWLLFAAANWIDLAVQGRDHESVVAAAVLLLVTGFAYVTAWRPRLIADEAGVTVRNPLRDHRIGWARVTKVDVADLLRVHCAPGAPGVPAATAPAASGDAGREKRDKVISSWAVHYSRRRQLSAESRARRGSRPRRSSFGMPSRGLSMGGPVAAPAPASPEAEAEKIVRILSERATAAQAETAWAADGTRETRRTAIAGWLEPLASTWSGRALAAIGIPALILLIVCLA